MNIFYKNYLKAFYFKKYEELYSYEIRTASGTEKSKLEKVYKIELKNYNLMIEHFSSNINRRINERGYIKKEKNELISEKIIVDGLGLKYNPIYKKSYYYIQIKDI